MNPFVKIDTISGHARTIFAGIVAALIVLLAGSYAFVRYDTGLYRAQKLREAEVQAQILAQSVSASLAFLDPDAAQGYLNALGVNPEIEAAAVYDAEGRKFASFTHQGAQSFPANVAPQIGEENGATITIVEPVVTASGPVGTVALRAITEPLMARLKGYGGLLAALVMAAILLGVLVAGLTVLAEANTRLRIEMEERRRIEEALRQSQKMESIGQLAGGIAHDFNNTLAIIIGSLGLLKLRAERKEEGWAHYANIALEGAQRAATLTQRLLAFSRRQPLSPQQVDVNRLVSGMSELLRGTLGETTHTETVLAGGLWKVHIDAHQLESALVNLAINSRDAMPDGGKLTIETANAYLDEAYCRRDRDATPGQYVMIAVTDTGAGMPPDVAEKAFDPFFTTKPVGKGTGLGLSQVYGFVKQSGGHVKIYSEAGHGTTVRLYLPRFAGDSPAAADPAQTMVARTPQDHTILVVEDDQAVRKMAVDVLRELGYRVLQAADGPDALRVLKEHPGIDLLFTDVVMPGMDGRKLAEQALRLLPNLKVIHTTGYTKNAVVHNGTVDRDVNLLSKPFTVAQLSQQIRAVLKD